MQPTEYSKVVKLIHWTIAILVICNYIGGLLLDYVDVNSLHRQTGFLILILVVFRIFWRVSHKYPKPATTLTNAEKILSTTVHKLLYVFMLIVPLCGLLTVNALGEHVVFFGITIPAIISKLSIQHRELLADAHSVLASTFITLVGLHVLGALKHYFINKDDVLFRMLPKGCHKSLK